MHACWQLLLLQASNDLQPAPNPGCSSQSDTCCLLLLLPASLLMLLIRAAHLADVLHVLQEVDQGQLQMPNPWAKPAPMQPMPQEPLYTLPELERLYLSG